jgi:hypothetical protein
MTCVDECERLTKAQRLLPAWFVPRMMDDCWFFGLMLETGHLLVIEQVLDVRAGPGGLTSAWPMPTTAPVIGQNEQPKPSTAK